MNSLTHKAAFDYPETLEAEAEKHQKKGQIIGMTNQATDQIIQYIETHKISTSQISDCMGKKGVIDQAYALNEGHFKVGKTHYSYCDHESNWNVHKNIQDLEQGCIVFVDDLGANGRAIFGDIVTKYIIDQGIPLSRKIKAR